MFYARFSTLDVHLRVPHNWPHAALARGPDLAGAQQSALSPLLGRSARRRNVRRMPHPLVPVVSILPPELPNATHDRGPCALIHATRPNRRPCAPAALLSPYQPFLPRAVRGRAACGWVSQAAAAARRVGRAHLTSPFGAPPLVRRHRRCRRPCVRRRRGAMHNKRAESEKYLRRTHANDNNTLSIGCTDVLAAAQRLGIAALPAPKGSPWSYAWPCLLSPGTG